MQREEIQILVNKACQILNISRNEFFASQKRPACNARHVIFYILKRERLMKMKDIRAYFEGFRCTRQWISTKNKEIEIQKEVYPDLYFLYHKIKEDLK